MKRTFLTPSKENLNTKLMNKAFKIHSADNVATVLDETEGRIAVLGSEEFELDARSVIPAGHKVALRCIAAGDAVVKFGVRIGHATADIQAGEWVHLNNLASDLDERSGTLDAATGAPTDTRYE